MKLATLRDGSRDGLLAVVSRDGSLAHVAQGRARTLQQALDDWNFYSPQLEDLSLTLNQGKARHAFSLQASACMAPLPRAGCWAWWAATAATDTPGATGISEPTHTVLEFAPGHRFWGPTAEVDWPVAPGHADAELTVQPGLVALSGDLAAGASADAAVEAVRLLLLAVRWQAGAQAQRSAFAPLAITPDELGPAWQQGRVHAQLHWQVAARTAQQWRAEQASAWQAPGFGRLLAQLAEAGPVPAGSLLGSGVPQATVSGPGPGERLRLDCTAADGLSLFGAIDLQRATTGNP